MSESETSRRARRGRRRGEQPMVPPAEFTSYYGKPVLNAPVWEPRDIAGYLFLGGLAGASSLLGAGAQLTGRPALERAAKADAFGAACLSMARWSTTWDGPHVSPTCSPARPPPRPRACACWPCHRIRTRRPGTSGCSARAWNLAAFRTMTRGGAYLRAGEALTVLGAAGALTGSRHRLLGQLSGAALLAASAATRWGIFHAGLASARDPKYTVIPQRQRLGHRGSPPPRDAPRPENSSMSDVQTGYVPWCRKRVRRPAEQPRTRELRSPGPPSPGRSPVGVVVANEGDAQRAYQGDEPDLPEVAQHGMHAGKPRHVRYADADG